MKFLHVILIILLLSVCGNADGQYYDTGEDPWGLKWSQIKTRNFRVIFPSSWGDEGLKFAADLEDSFSRLSTLYNVSRVRMPVIIHNYSTFSNGYVAWAPRRMEIYPAPEQGTIPLDNYKQLTLHEGAHVMQMHSLNRGFTKSMNLFFGEQFTGFVTALLPIWYLEGDAVFAETYLSSSGRGRSAQFQKQLKAISVERGKMYKYDRLVNGSYRHFIPDEYMNGYQTMAHSFSNYNSQSWNKALKTTANAPFLIDPVNLSLWKNTGHTKKKMMNETFNSLTGKWQAEDALKGYGEYEIINPDKRKKQIDYHSPQKVSETSYAAIKTSLAHPPHFVLINISDKTEERLLIPGRMADYSISSANKTLVWVETQPDPRWNNRNYSVIKIMDLRDKSVRQLTWKSRFMAASLSPDGRLIAGVENSIQNKNSLVLIDAKTGQIMKTFPVPANTYLQKPQWSSDGKKISFITLTSGGEGIIAFTLQDFSWMTLLEESSIDYQSAFIRNDSLFFVKTVSGTENIYAMLPDKKIIRLTNSRFGTTDLTSAGAGIIFSDYSFSGNNICRLAIKRIPVQSEKDTSLFMAIDQVKIKLVDYSNDKINEKYSSEKYRKWLNLFRFHSWMPFYADIEQIRSDPASVRPGFTILSQNLLSTLVSSFGYEYSNKLHKFHSQVTWKGWYPVIEARTDYGDDPNIYKLGYTVEDPPDAKPETFLTGTISLPLTFSTSNFTQTLRPSFSAVYQNSYIFQDRESGYDYGQTMFSGRFFFSNYQLSSIRDIYPKLAQVVDLNFSFYPFDRKFYDNILTLRTALYFPGFIRNNSLRLRYENEVLHFKTFIQFNRINFPRGYKNIASEELGYFSADYAFPLLYPDFNLLSLFYLKRIKASLFYDYATGRNNYYFSEVNGDYNLVKHHDYSESFYSGGIELTGDFHVLRLPYLVSAGIQASWIRGSSSPVFEMIFNIDIYGMSIGKNRR